MAHSHDRPDTLSSPEKQRILDAALTELVSIRHTDDFTLEVVARRAGVDVFAVKQFWPNTPALFSGALIAWGEHTMPIPDTGTLRSDLLEYSRSFAAAINTPIGRRFLDSVVISPRDWDSYGSRAEFRKARPGRIAVMVDRAIGRGECPTDLNPAMAVELLASALCMPVLFYDEPISDEYCTRIVDLLLSGLLSR